MNLAEPFFRHAQRDPDAPALWVGGRTYTYGQLAKAAEKVRHLYKGEALWRLYWMFDDPHVSTYATLLGIVASDHGYVPVKSEPEARWQKVLDSVDGCGFEDAAYVMFTSGSTGEPKGVPITNENAYAYINHTIERLDLGPDDRVSQMHDLTFDFSVHDIWPAWHSGACVYRVPKPERMAPAKFIREHELTVFSCVPSVAAMMDRLGLLTDGAFPSLRRVVFCGEALPQRSAEAMQRAAPNAVIENMYGPTECTVGCTVYRWTDDSPKVCRNGIVPIGRPFPGHEVHITDDGELCVKGPQVAGGYWRNERETWEKFGPLPGKSGCWYRTGDIVEQDEDGLLHYIGRKDHQVQIRGHRVELGEVDAAVGDVLDISEVACVVQPVAETDDKRIIAFCAGPDCRHMGMDQELGERLPEYMLPADYVFMDRLPRNQNGKIDRRALAERLGKVEVAG